METTLPPALKPDYDECLTLARSHYENFPVASLLLRREVRPHVAALYAFARTADDLADEPAYKGRRLKEIDRWEKGLRSALTGKTAHPYLAAFAHTMRTFSIPLSLPLALLKAFRMDASFKPPKDWAALLHYCRHSADPVGRMVLLLHGIREEKLHRLSDRICTGLQLINFWQDTSLDLSRGRLYFPASDLQKAGVRGKELLARAEPPAVRALMRSLVDRTEAHFREGTPLLSEIPGRLGLELKATFFGGMAILNKVRAMDYNVLRQRPALNAFDKARIGFQALLGQ